MPVKKLKKKNKGNKLLQFFNPKTFRGGAALFLLVFVLAGAAFLVYRSFAGTAPSSRRYPDVIITSNIPWTSQGVLSTDGKITIKTKLWDYSQRIPGLHLSYRIYIQERTPYGSWRNTGRYSARMQANGNSDYECFDRSIDKGKIYRAEIRYPNSNDLDVGEFASESGFYNTRGPISVYGYKNVSDCE